MNFVKQVEEQLRDLGTESRHKYPGVKEASERAILSLRLLQNKYVAAVRQATRSIGEDVSHDSTNPNSHATTNHHPFPKNANSSSSSSSISGSHHRIAHPTTQMFQSQDILRPFLLAANYPNVGNRILQLSLDGIQTLLAGQAICKQDGVHIVRVLHIQAHVCATAIYGKNHYASYGLSSSSSFSSSFHGVKSGIVGGGGGGGGGVWGSMVENYMTLPSAAGNVVNAGVGTISSLGNSILSGFGLKSSSGGSGMGTTTAIVDDVEGGTTGGGGGECTVVKTNVEPCQKNSTTAASTATSTTSTAADPSVGPSSTSAVSRSANHFVHPKRSIGSAAHASHRTVKEDEAISIRILQILAIIIGSEDIELSEELLSQCMGICLILGACTFSDVNFSSDEETRQRVNSLGKMNHKRHESSNIFKIHGGRSLRKKDGHGGGSKGQNVSSAASATFRQIVSTLFSRGENVPNVDQDTACDDDNSLKCLETHESNEPADIVSSVNMEESHRIQSLAAKTLLDLCCLVEGKACNGPIGQALVGQQRNVARPSQYVCLSLMDMILDQHFELFANPRTLGDDDDDDTSLCFNTILKDKIIPLVTKLLSNYEKGIDDANANCCEDSSPLALMLKLTIIATSIVTKNCNDSSLEKQCQNLLMAVSMPIKSATRLLRDSHDYEDGFVYSVDTADELKDQTEHEQIKTDEKWLLTLWAATISIEAIYSLISKHFESMLPLFLAEENDNSEDSLLSSLISIICDFVVVASSSKSSISKLIQAVECGFQYEQEEEKAFNEVKDMKSSFGQGNYSDVFVREESFAVKRIRPFVVSNAKSMSEYDLGGTVWIAMNCIFLSCRYFQTCDLNEEAKLQLIGGCFGPSLVVIQHLLRRCPVSEVVCRSSLSAYLCLSRALLPIGRDKDSRREVILATLCKLIVPLWFDDNSRKLLMSNIMAMTLLFEVLYYNANDISADWHIVLKCLSKLSELTHSGSNPEKNIEFNLSRIGRLSVFLNDMTLKHLVSAFIHLSLSDDRRSSSAHSNSFGRTTYENAVGKLQTTRFITKPDELQNISFPLVGLFLISVENYGRFECFGESVIRHYSSQASKNKSSVVRNFAFDVVSHSIVSVLTLDAESKVLHQKMLMEPFCGTIQTTNYIDAAEIGLSKLKQILEDGHDLSATWPLIMSTLTTVANSSHGVDDWGLCSSTAFACLKLMVDDFLNDPPEQEFTRVELLNCCGAFCSSRFDINTSLTAIGMLWSIADQDSSSSSVDYVLSKLAHLAADDRVEVRNCVVNTLFSCIVGLGHSFNAMQWQEILTNTIFAVLDQVKDQGNTPINSPQRNSLHESKVSDRYKVSVHHSRDSISKQWATTQVLTLRGIERVLRHFFDQLLHNSTKASKSQNLHSIHDEKNWFDEAWYRILDQCLTCSRLLGGREYLDLRLAGVDLLILCCQTASYRGFVAADVRVGTNMQVVNGALRSVRSTSSGSSVVSSGTRSPKVMDIENMEPDLMEKRSMLFEHAFDRLLQFKAFLKEHETDIRGDGYVDSVHIQVLTRIGQGLAQLYESCKGYELSLDHQGGEKEAKFVDFVSLIMSMARGNQRSKFLTQAQRPCLDLLKTMSLNGSSCAFEVIVLIGSKIVLNQNQESDYDILQVEAGKVISEICSNPNVNVAIDRTTYGVVVTVDLLQSIVDAKKGKDNENPMRLVDKGVDIMEPTNDKMKDAMQSVKQEKNSDIIQMKEINAELMRQVEKLQAQKDKLEQQVAVLSEGTAYI